MNRIPVYAAALLAVLATACGGEPPVPEETTAEDRMEARMEELMDSMVAAGDVPEWLARDWFPPLEDYAGTFTDAHVNGLLVVLDDALAEPEMAANVEGQANEIFYQLGNVWQTGPLDAAQTATVLGHLEAVAGRYPNLAEQVAAQQFLVENLIPGRVAPNIVGRDTEGVEFALEEYRGKIVVIIFTGEWCGPCRGEYPYQRALLDIYTEDDLILLGVNSDVMLDVVREAKVREGLAYRTWWDGHSQPDAKIAAAEGPIATAWGVTGWPETYVLDENGVIVHVGLTSGELIAAIDTLVWERWMP